MKINNDVCRFGFLAFTALFGLSIVIACFWGAWSLFVGPVPHGWCGWSRWWDVLIGPAWVAVSVLYLYFAHKYDHPSWFVRGGRDVSLFLWTAIGCLSIILGFKVLAYGTLALGFLSAGLGIWLFTRKRRGYCIY